MDSGAWCTVVHWVTKSWTWLSNWTELNKLGNLKEMEKLLETYNLQKLNQDESEKFKQTSNKYGALIISSQKLPIIEKPMTKRFRGWFLSYFQSRINTNLLKILPKKTAEGSKKTFISPALSWYQVKDTTRKSQIIIHDEYKCKNSQQNTSTQIQQHIKWIIYYNQV